MALSITSIAPVEGVTPGKDRITIEGTDFDIHPYPPVVTGYIGRSLGPSLRVLIGGIEATKVIVYPKVGGLPGETVIECSTPRYIGDPEVLPALVDVTVENLLTPASVTSVDAFTYQQPSAIETSRITEITYALLSELARQTPIKAVNIVQQVHTDFDDSTGDLLNLVKIAEVPCLIVTGPRLLKSSGNYANYDGVVDVDGDPLNWVEERRLFPRDLSYELTLVDNLDARFLNLIGIIDRFVDNNGSLKVEDVIGDPSAGFTDYDLDWVSMMASEGGGNNDNLLTANGTIIVRGVALERVGGIQTGRAVLTDDSGVVITTQKIG